MKLSQLQEAKYFKKFDLTDKKTRLRLRHKIRDLVGGKYSPSTSDSESYSVITDLPFEDTVSLLRQEFGQGKEHMTHGAVPTPHGWSKGPGEVYAVHWDLGDAGSIDARRYQSQTDVTHYDTSTHHWLGYSR